MRMGRLVFAAAWMAVGMAPWHEAAAADSPIGPPRTEVYKRVDGIELRMTIYEPPGHQPTDRRSAIVFFFGGGWRSGSPAQFERQCQYLAARGMVAMAADYRVYSRHQARVIDCVADAKSAIRWVRTHAGRLGVDPDRLASAGGSAGGHLAAAVATLAGFEEAGEDTSVPARPNAMLLFNPALDLAPEAFPEDFRSQQHAELRARMGAEPRALSPTAQVKPGVPPAIVFHGKADATVPFAQAERFTEAMKSAGNRCELAGYEGQGHGFFNFGRNGNQMFNATLRRADEFLASLGYLSGPPTIEEAAPPGR